METKDGIKISDKATKNKRGALSRIISLTAYCVTAAGAIYSTALFASGKFETDVYVYKMIGAAVSAALFVSIYAFERLAKLRIPDFPDAFLKLFIVCALVLGRCFDLYTLIPLWDKILHTVSGFLFFLIGMCVGSFVFGERRGMSDRRYAVALALFAFLFALGAGYAWELLEFAGDSLLGMDNQGWSEGLVAENADGTFTVTDKRGTALLDTLGDMYVNFIGATVCFALCLVRYLRRPEKLSELSVIRTSEKKSRP